MGEYIPAVQWSSALLPLLKEGHELRLPLSGRSMFPLIAGGRDEIVISDCSGKMPVRGDIALFVRKDGTHVLHRIHHVKGGRFYMLGDAQTVIEGPVEKEDLLAIAVAVIRKGKTIKCSRLFFRAISELWLLVRPFRPVFLRIALKIHRVFVRIRIILSKSFKKGGIY